jgi:23S rRNA (cytidine2498-2'-O)-methyltransferase
MKKRYESVRDCLMDLTNRLDAAEHDYIVRCKQLYHDREEVTAFVSLH